MRIPWARIGAGIAALLLAGAALAAPRAWLDRDTVQLGEPVTLNIEAEAGGADPDFSVLEQDFEILGRSSRSQISIVNGQRSSSTLWAVVLEPRRAGSLVIPSFDLAGGATRPLTVTVADAADDPAEAGADVYLEVELEPQRPYVQQQARYTVRLYYAVTLLEGSLDEPQVDGVELRRLGSDRSYQSTLSGRRYNVVERRYALIPERSGRIELPGPRFRGRAIGSRRSFTIDGEPVGARGETVVLEVRPRPDAAPEPWLPARDLRLQAKEAELPEEVHVGEPLTLTLSVRAVGLGPAQLPELALPAVDGAQVYPDQPSTREAEDGGWLVGERERRFAIVPDRPGELRIPEVELRWWDVSTDRERTATVPGRSIRVLPAATAAQPQVDSGTTAAEPELPVRVQHGLWPWLATALALGWLATLVWALRRRPPVAAVEVPRAPPELPADLRAALRHGDAAAIGHALVATARRHGAPVRNLGELAPRLEPAQRDAVEALEAARFGGGETAAALAAVRRAFADGLRLQAQRSAHGAGPLPPLYPR